MLLKILALAVAAIPVLLFVRSVLFRRPTRMSQGFQQFKRQVDVFVWLFIATVGVIAVVTLARMAWTWWS
jgi:ethanolamine transporter EutH